MAGSSVSHFHFPKFATVYSVARLWILQSIQSRDSPYSRTMKTLFTFLLALFLLATLAQAQVARADYYENGQKKYQGNVDGDKKVGEWVYYYDNGDKLREGVYQDGEPVGIWKEYWKGGQVKSEGKYVIVKGEAVKQGLWTTYHKNGAKEREGKYEAGKPVGTWFEYNTLGIEVKKTVLQ
jgi:antitoxin component YwqK of YwqJK toxin-antitoxin module